MKAAVFLHPQSPLEIRTYPETEPTPGMAVVELVSTGICGTDIHIWDGALALQGPMILGHELLGRVRTLGSGATHDGQGQALISGDLVAVNVVEPCQQCILCIEGGAASCLHLLESLTYTRSPEEPPHFHGGFAEINYSPARYLMKVPSVLPADVVGAFLCAGPTVIRGVAYAGGISPGSTVVVQGAGPVGLFAVLYAKQQGAGRVVLLGSCSHPLRLELATALGADEVMDIRQTTQEERHARILALTAGRGADLILEGTGNPEAITEGLGLLRNRGIYIMTGQYSNRGAVAIPTHVITFNALQIFGSAQFTSDDRTAYFSFLTRVPTLWETIRRVVTDRFTLDNINTAFSRTHDGAAIKTLIVPG